jgi:hypothetical protein
LVAKTPARLREGGVDGIDWGLSESIPLPRKKRESRQSSWHARLLAGRRMAAGLGDGRRARVRTRAREEEEGGHERREKDEGREIAGRWGILIPEEGQRRRRSSGTSTARQRIGWSLHRQRAAYRLEEDDDQRKLGRASAGLRYGRGRERVGPD